MRRRSSFIHDNSLDFNPDEIKVHGENFNRLSFAGLKAAREERLTYGLDQLPEEVQLVLNDVHELHLRWASEHHNDVVSPFLSRISPGLHVLFTPLEGRSDSLLCPLLRKCFSEQLKCRSPNATFIQPPVLSERFASTSSLQYHSLLPSLERFTAYVQRKVCPHSDVICAHAVSGLNIADSLDIDYDSISHALTVTAFWSRPPPVYLDPIGQFTAYDVWNLDISLSSNTDRIEVGVLSASEDTNRHNLELSGFLTVLGEDDHPKPTRFHFPSRHHSLLQEQSRQQRYAVCVQQPQGLHPVLQISFENASAMEWPSSRPEGSQCSLQSYLTLPSHVFVDQYALRSDDQLFKKAHKIGDVHAVAGEMDLEAPDYVIQKWGSNVLLKLMVPRDFPVAERSSSKAQSWDITIPLHLRYLAPSPEGIGTAELPWPIVFWACTAEDGTKFPVNPFDRVNLGFEGMYGPRTMFYHLQPALPSSQGVSRMIETVRVPVYRNSYWDASVVDNITLLCVVGGFLWIFIGLVPGIRKQIGRWPGLSDRLEHADAAKKDQ